MRVVQVKVEKSYYGFNLYMTKSPAYWLIMSESVSGHKTWSIWFGKSSYIVLTKDGAALY